MTSAPRGLTRPAVAVTLFGLAAQAVALAIQILIARVFGAGAAVDAFFAANTLPQYVFSVLLGTLPSVFVPVIAAYMRDQEESSRVATGVLTVFAGAMFVAACIGTLFAGPLLRLITPGLPPTTHALAVRLAWILWPSVVASTAASLLTGMSHARHRFAWPAAVPLVAGVVNAVLLMTLHGMIGIFAVAVAQTAGLALQVVLLLPVLRGGRARWSRAWAHPAVRRVLALAWPLVLSGFLIRITQLVERYLASGFPAGSIAHVAYASRVLQLVTMLFGTGIATVLFPRMSDSVARDDFGALHGDFVRATRAMWVCVAPAMTIGFALAFPAVAALLQHGRFTAGDTAAVGALLRLYLLAAPGACLGLLTGRVLFALQKTSLLAGAGALEAVLYVAYTALLVHTLGIKGLPVGFALYMNLSLAWHLVAIGWVLRGAAERALWMPAARTAMAALIGGATAVAVVRFVPGAWPQLILGGLAAAATYAAALWLFNRDDARVVSGAIARLRPS